MYREFYHLKEQTLCKYNTEVRKCLQNWISCVHGHVMF